MLSIKVLGPGCMNCVMVERVAREAVADLGVEAKIEKVTDFFEILKYRGVATPGLVINERLVCAGRVPGTIEVKALLTNALAQES
jgi:small redox-active disulfide protein 2